MNHCQIGVRRIDMVAEFSVEYVQSKNIVKGNAPFERILRALERSKVGRKAVVTDALYIPFCPSGICKSQAAQLQYLNKLFRCLCLFGKCGHVK